MTKIISFSLWGKDPKYTIGAVRNAELAKSIYSGWICRFYVGEDVEEEIKKQLLDNGAEVVEMGGADWNGMFWRFFAASELGENDVMVSRDTDSRLGWREKLAVNEWLESDYSFHIMRDHPYHKTEILGGMWGVRGTVLNDIKEMISDYDTGDYDNKYQVDQNFLRDVVYKLAQENAKVHDTYFEQSHFPTLRETPQDFVGQVYDEHERPQF